MLHLPSMLTYGFLSFSMAFLNKALFEIADFRSSLFVILFQLIFVLLSFQIFGFFRLVSVPVITRHDAHVFLVPSIFYCLSTITSLQALMKLNVAIYVVIKVRQALSGHSFADGLTEKDFLLLAMYTSIDVRAFVDGFEERETESAERALRLCHYHWCCDSVDDRSVLPSRILHHRHTQCDLSSTLPADHSTV